MPSHFLPLSLPVLQGPHSPDFLFPQIFEPVTHTGACLNTSVGRACLPQPGRPGPSCRGTCALTHPQPPACPLPSTHRYRASKYSLPLQWHTGAPSTPKANYSYFSNGSMPEIPPLELHPFANFSSKTHPVGEGTLTKLTDLEPLRKNGSPRNVWRTEGEGRENPRHQRHRKGARRSQIRLHWRPHPAPHSQAGPGSGRKLQAR